MAAADRYLYDRLLWLTDYDSAIIPSRFQPKNQRDLAARSGLDRSTIAWATTHLVRHGWVTLTCGRDGCERTGPHTGPGHRLHYALHHGQDCPGEECRSTCRTGNRTARLAATHSQYTLNLAAAAALLILTCHPAASSSTMSSTQNRRSVAVFRPKTSQLLVQRTANYREIIMKTETVTLDLPVFHVRPPEHTKYDCLCDDCWGEYLEWCDREMGQRAA